MVWGALCHGLLCYVSLWDYGLAQRFCAFVWVVGWCLLFICCGVTFVLICDLWVVCLTLVCLLFARCSLCCWFLLFKGFALVVYLGWWWDDFLWGGYGALEVCFGVFMRMWLSCYDLWLLLA